jgi:hypothetical protein
MMWRGIGRRGLLAGAGGLLTSPAIVRAQSQGNGVALVIGNSKYQWEDSLPNVRRDASDIAAHFQALGLATELLENLGRDALRKALEKFGAAARGANLAVVYFAGHGAFWEDYSYIVPVDVDLSEPSAVKRLIGASVAAKLLNDAAHSLLVYDSCRNNPADGWRQREAETQAAIHLNSTSDASAAATIRLHPNSLRLSSTAPGATALDGPAGGNSPFAAAFMRQLESESIDLQALAGKTRRDLLIATQGRQLAWDANAFTQPFPLAGPRRAPGSSRLSYDPSTIVEFGKAYAFAQQNGMTLPDGLVGIRAVKGNAAAQKIGSFSFELTTAGERHSMLLLVLSVAGDGSSVAVVASNNPKAASWRLVSAIASNDGLEVQPHANAGHYLFRWRDANSGTMSTISQSGKTSPSGKASSPTHPFTRLDG